MAVKIVRTPPPTSPPPKPQPISPQNQAKTDQKPATKPATKPVAGAAQPKKPTLSKTGKIIGRPKGTNKRTKNPLKTLDKVMADRGNMPAKDKKLVKQAVSYPDFIKRLTVEQKAILDSNMLANKTEGAILNLLLEWGADGGQSESTLRKAIQRYRYKFIEPQQAQIASNALKQQTPSHIKRLAVAAEAMEKILKPVSAIEEVILHQMQRVNKLKDTEARMPTLLDSQTKNLSLLTDMLFKLSNLHLEIGLLRKVPQKHDVTMTAEQQAFVTSLKVDDQVNAAKLNVLSMLTERGILTPKGVQLAPIPSALDASEDENIIDALPSDPDTEGNYYEDDEGDTEDGEDGGGEEEQDQQDQQDGTGDSGYTEGEEDFMQPPTSP